MCNCVTYSGIFRCLLLIPFLAEWLFCLFETTMPLVVYMESLSRFYVVWGFLAIFLWHFLVSNGEQFSPVISVCKWQKLLESKLQSVSCMSALALPHSPRGAPWGAPWGNTKANMRGGNSATDCFGQTSGQLWVSGGQSTAAPEVAIGRRFIFGIGNQEAV